MEHQPLYMGEMSQDLTKMLLDSMKAGKQKAGRARQEKYHGFDSENAAKVFRAVAAVHPKAVLIKEAKWLTHAELHTERGFMKCAIYAHGPTYRLTESGVRRAKAERLIKDS